MRATPTLWPAQNLRGGEGSEAEAAKIFDLLRGHGVAAESHVFVSGLDSPSFSVVILLIRTRNQTNRLLLHCTAATYVDSHRTSEHT